MHHSALALQRGGGLAGGVRGRAARANLALDGLLTWDAKETGWVCEVPAVSWLMAARACRACVCLRGKATKSMVFKIHRAATTHHAHRA